MKKCDGIGNLKAILSICDECPNYKLCLENTEEIEVKRD